MSSSATGLPPGLSLNTTTGLIGGTVALGPVNARDYVVTLTAGDGTCSASTSFVWSVSSPITVTDPGDQSSTEGNSVSLQVAASEPDGASLTFSAAGLPPGLTMSAGGLISGTITAGAAAQGPYVTTVTAGDGTTTSSTTFAWEVSSPVSITDPGPQYAGAGSPASVPMQASDSAGGTLTWSATGLPTGLSIDSATGLISGTISATAGSDTPYTATVTASDGTCSASQSVVWLVAAPAVGGAVTLYNPGDQSCTEGNNVSLQVQATDGTTGAALTYSADGLPLGLTINATTGLITGTLTPGSAWQGPCLVTLTATDGTDSASTSFVWQVNGALTLADPGEQSSAEGNAVSLQVQTTDGSGGTPTFGAVGCRRACPSTRAPASSPARWRRVRRDTARTW